MLYQQFLNESLKEAASIATENFGKVAGFIKGSDNNQVLTETDIAIGKLLVEKVKRTYPTYNIIDEEAGVVDNGSEYTWIIDPIDGTSNFASGVPTYGIMMGLLKNDTPIAGGVVNPYFKDICIAEKGQGTYLNGEKINVTNEAKLSNCLVAYHIDGHQENPQQTKDEAKIFAEIVLAIRNMRNTGCEPVDAVWVAKGSYGALLNHSMKIWDAVAPQIIIEEAGGIYTDFFGKVIDYTNPLSKTEQNFTSCAASPTLHKQLQEIIHKTTI